MPEHLSDAERARLDAVCTEVGTDVPHLAAEARRWKEIAGRLGLSLSDTLDLISRLDGMPRDPTSADWRDVEKIAAEASLAELWYAQQQSGSGDGTPPRENAVAEHRPPGWSGEDE